MPEINSSEGCLVLLGSLLRGELVSCTVSCLHDFENSYSPEQFLLMFVMFPQLQALFLTGEAVSLFCVLFFFKSMWSLGQQSCV